MLPFLSFSSDGGGVGQGGLINASQLSTQACDKNTIHSKTTAPMDTGAYNGKAVVFTLTLSIQGTLLRTKETYWYLFFDKIIKKKKRSR